MACTYNAIYYGGLTFTGFPTSTINSEMVRDEGGNVVKYIRNTLEVELIITMETCAIDAGIAVGSIDADMDYIRQVLSCPNKSFNLSYRGAGRGFTPLQYDSELYADLTPALPSRFNTLAMHGLGVFPEVLTWEPLAGSKAARCRWRCTFFTSKASPDLSTRPLKFSTVEDELPQYNVDRTITSGGVVRTGKYREPANSAWQHPAVGSPGFARPYDWNILMISFTEEQEVDIDSEGFLVLTVKGVIEFSHEAVRTQLQHWANPADPGNRDYIEEFLNEPRNRRSIAQDLARYYQPYLPLGFTRKQRYVYDKTQRKLEYVIVDTEQVNPTAKFPRIITWEATHKVGSTLGTSDSAFSPQGFYTWENLFNGTFVVAPGYWKGWAWVAMLVLVKQRIERTIAFEEDIDQFAKDEVDSSTALVAGEAIQAAQGVARKKVVPKHILTDVSIVDYLHNNRVDVSLRYIVMTTLDKLFGTTGLFTKINSLFAAQADGVTPAGHPKDWTAKTRQEILESNRFYDSLSSNAVGYTGLGLSNYNIIFDPDNLNLPSAAYTDERGNPLPAYTPPHSLTNTQGSDVYAAHRRKGHYVDHPDPPFEETIPTNPQNPKDAAGTPANPSTSTNNYPGDETAQATWMKKLDKSQSWVDYKTNFKLVEVSNSSYVPTIQPATKENVQGAFDTTSSYLECTRNVPRLTINNKSTAPGAATGRANLTGYANHGIIAHGKPTYYLNFTGRATRVGYPIPMPVVGGLYNQSDLESPGLPVYRIGKQYWNHQQINQSADMPVYEAEWDITYAIHGDPTCSNISFNHSRQSEFA